MNSCYIEDEYRNDRNIINQSRHKEYEISINKYLSWINKINFLKDYQEKITHIDSITPELLKKYHKKTTLHLIRKTLEQKEHEILYDAGFKLSKTWATNIIDTSKTMFLDKGNRSIIKKAEQVLTFEKVDDITSFRAYYQLLKKIRAVCS